MLFTTAESSNTLKSDAIPSNYRSLEPTNWYQSVLRKRGKGKGKSVPLQAWSGTEGSRKLRFPDFMTTAQEGCKFVSLTHRPR